MESEEKMRDAVKAGIDAWKFRKAIDHQHGADPDCEACIEGAIRAALVAAHQSAPAEQRKGDSWFAKERDLTSATMASHQSATSQPTIKSDSTQVIINLQKQLEQMRPLVEAPTIVNLGLGKVGIQHGQYGGQPAVFIRPVAAPGPLGELTGDDGPQDRLIPNEVVLVLHGGNASVLLDKISQALATIDQQEIV